MKANGPPPRRQMAVLEYLRECIASDGSAPGLDAMAFYFGIDVSSVAQAVKRLRAKGLVDRRPCPTCGTSVLVVTDK